jgi:lipid-binding SYLF domain-containing protein
MKLGSLGLSLGLLLLADTHANDVKRLDAAATVLNEIMHAKDKGVPRDLMERAYCVGVVPGLKRAGFVVGAKYGKGVVTCRMTGANKWSAPSLIIIEGGSIGLQIGLGETDLVFTVNNHGGEDKLMKDKVTIGGDVAGMIGPVGREAQAQTDALMHAEILSWSRSRGVFAGVSLEGASLRADNDDNKALYRRVVTQQEILHGKVTPPAAARSLYQALRKYAPGKRVS